MPLFSIFLIVFSAYMIARLTYKLKIDAHAEHWNYEEAEKIITTDAEGNKHCTVEDLDLSNCASNPSPSLFTTAEICIFVCIIIYVLFDSFGLILLTK